MRTKSSAPPSEELLKLFIEQCREYAVVLTAPDGTVLDWLGGAELIFGYTREEMVGRSVARLFTPEDIQRKIPEHELEVSEAVGRMEDDRWEVRKDGARIWVTGTVIPLRDARGELVAFAKIMRDRTDLKMQTDAMENRLKARSEADQRTSAFLATVVHELRNPIMPVANAVQMIRQSGRVEGITDAALKIIDRQTDAMRRLVEDLADFARLGAGKLQLDWQVQDLKDVVRVSAEEARPLAEQRQQNFRVILIDGPVPVCGDPGRLRQVFANLLRNAIKYTPAGGAIWFRCTTEGHEAVVRVEDTGVGISADILPRIFDVFTQAESSEKVAPGGLGVGLSVVRELVTLHGGTVQARSEGKNKGSVFTVRLPLHLSRAPSADSV